MARAAAKKGRGRGPTRGPVYAAIDLGTHNCRMLLASPDGQGLRVVGSFSRVVRLGEDVAGTGRLRDDAMDRTLDALAVCAQRMRGLGVVRSRNVATAACRLAGNSSDFLSRVKSETGLDFEIISAEEEARLTLVGCIPLLRRRIRNALLMDIGGGSTEVAWVAVDGGGRAEIVDLISLDIGVVTLAEEFGGRVLPEDGRRAIIKRLHDRLRDFDGRNRISDHLDGSRVQMVGTSGTVTTLGALHLGLGRYDRNRVDGLRLGFDDATAIGRALMAKDVEERAAIPAIGPERAEMVGVGCAVMEAIQELWPIGSLTVADRGIREGLLLELMADDRARAGHG